MTHDGETRIAMATKTCYYANCKLAPKWAVRTEHSVDPNGQPFHLYTCDEHCGELTDDCRKAGTRYLLRPLESGPAEPPPKPEDPSAAFANYSRPVKIIAIICAGIMMMALMPFVIGFYLIKAAFFGWRPPENANG
jgi:hypothetical protein